MTGEYVDFFVIDFMDNDVAIAGIDVATTEAACTIVDRLAHETRLKYGIDYKFEMSYFDQQGNRRIKFWFKDEQTAFMVKLKGFKK
jgi:hypothetical protein